MSFVGSRHPADVKRSSNRDRTFDRNFAPVYPRQIFHRLDRLLFVVDNKPGHPLFDSAMTGVPQAIALIINRPKGSGHLIGNMHPTEKADFPRSSTSPISWTCVPSISGSRCFLK